MKVYISYLRIAATFAVILLHTVATYVGKFPRVDIDTWHIANTIDSCMRACVPIFVLISGALLLDKQEPLGMFMSKRIKRIGIPLLFWSIVYLLWQTFIGQIQWSGSIIMDIKRVYMLLKTGVSYHFWYIYMILGLYLLMPILRRWVQQAPAKELLYFLGIWSITLWINPYTKTYFPAIELMYFSKYVGYLILGYYLDKYIVPSKKVALLAFSCLVVGILCTALLTYYFSKNEQHFVGVFYGNLTPNVCLSAIGYFLLAKCFLQSQKSIILLADSYTFGIFFIHVIVLYYIHRYSPFLGQEKDTFTYLLYVGTTAIQTAVISFVMIFLANRVPILKKWIQ